LQKRRVELLQKFSKGLEEIKELEEGYAFRFKSDVPTLEELIEIIRLERECCAFLQFRLTVEPDRGPVWLDITGPEGTRNFLLNELGIVGENSEVKVS
jgi:hypothetical protein